MKRFLLAVGAIGLTAVASNSAMAKGGVLHLFKTQMEAFASTSPASRAGVQSLSEFLTGCGRGRYRVAATHRCRGPADTGY